MPSNLVEYMLSKIMSGSFYLLETDAYNAREKGGYFLCHTTGYYQYLKLELRDNTRGFIEIQNEVNE